MIIILDNAALGPVKTLANHTANERSDKNILYRRPLHKRLYAKPPPYGRHTRAVEQRPPEIKSARTRRHKISRTRIGM